MELGLGLGFACRLLSVVLPVLLLRLKGEALGGALACRRMPCQGETA